MLLQSRGGLMGLSWLMENVASPKCIAMIYPVTDLRQWLGTETFSQQWGMSNEEMLGSLGAISPINAITELVKNGTKLFVIHGDDDKVVVPEYSVTFVYTYRYIGGDAQFVRVPGEGHNSSPSFFQSEDLTAFLIENLK